MIRVTFDTGAGVVVAEAAAGARLLDVAQAAGMPLEGTCGGQIACATCHLVVAAGDFARLPPASGDEEDMLDLVANATRTSRLSCQIVLNEAMGDLNLRLP